MSDCITELPDELKSKAYIFNRHSICPRWRLYITYNNSQLVTRYLMEKHLGKKLRKGRQVNHRCNNSLCINIEHLYVGNQKQNMKDRVRAGTTNKGLVLPKKSPEEIVFIKLSHEINAEIREIYRTKQYTQRYLAKIYGVSQPRIHNILHNC